MAPIGGIFEGVSLLCPKCTNTMRQYERNDVIIDQCTECGGIFLDRGELERLAQAEANYYNPSAAVPLPPREAPTSAPRGERLRAEPVYDERRGDEPYAERRYEDERRYDDRWYDERYYKKSSGRGYDPRYGKKSSGRGYDPRYGKSRRRKDFLSDVLDLF